MGSPAGRLPGGEGLRRTGQPSFIIVEVDAVADAGFTEGLFHERSPRSIRLDPASPLSSALRINACISSRRAK